MPRRREALASACWGGIPAVVANLRPPGVRPIGPTPLPTELGRTAGRGPSPLWREPWPVCLGCHTPQSAFIADRLPPPQICPITHDLGLPLPLDTSLASGSRVSGPPSAPAL